MIRVANAEDKRLIFDNYKRSSPNKALPDKQYYFDVVFNPGKVLVNEVNGHLISSLQVDDRSLSFKGKRLRISLMHNGFSAANKPAKYSQDLFETAVGYEAYKSLITLLPIADNNVPEGFETIYYQKLYSINRNDLENSSYQGVSKDFNLKILKQLYQQFTANFDGYLIRNDDYWDQMMDTVQVKRISLAVYYNDEGNPEGYMFYSVESAKVIVYELIYLNGEALTRLLCYGLHFKGTIQVYTSERENFKTAFPKIKVKVVPQIAAKVNDLELFNKFFDCDVADVKEAYMLCGKALYFNDLII